MEILTNLTRMSSGSPLLVDLLSQSVFLEQCNFIVPLCCETLTSLPSCNLAAMRSNIRPRGLRAGSTLPSESALCMGVGIAVVSPPSKFRSHLQVRHLIVVSQPDCRFATRQVCWLPWSQNYIFIYVFFVVRASNTRVEAIRKHSRQMK